MEASAVDSLLRRPDLVEEGLRKMLPFDTTYAVKCGEPYAMFNSYFVHRKPVTAPERRDKAGAPRRAHGCSRVRWNISSGCTGACRASH